jgi:hypothetical protein
VIEVRGEQTPVGETGQGVMVRHVVEAVLVLAQLLLDASPVIDLVLQPLVLLAFLVQRHAVAVPHQADEHQHQHHRDEQELDGQVGGDLFQCVQVLRGIEVDLEGTDEQVPIHDRDVGLDDIVGILFALERGLVRGDELAVETACGDVVPEIVVTVDRADLGRVGGVHDHAGRIEHADLVHAGLFAPLLEQTRAFGRHHAGDQGIASDDRLEQARDLQRLELDLVDVAVLVAREGVGEPEQAQDQRRKRQRRAAGEQQPALRSP